MSLYNKLKFYGRSISIPIDKVYAAIEEIFSRNNVTEITDFGSGTLFWSIYFAEKLKLRTYAVDTLYKKEPPSYDSNLISTHTDIYEILSQNIGKNGHALFSCHVIHHLTEDYWNAVFADFVQRYDVIVIIDIDATAKIGNFVNKLHDRVINKERVGNVYPQAIMNCLRKNNYSVYYESIRKLWYPHFMICAERISSPYNEVAI